MEHAQSSHMAPRVFISYRREDASGEAGRLADHLWRRFGKDRVFLDVDTIEPGSDFVRALKTSLEQTAAVLVVIGPRWTSVRDAEGVRRLDKPGDYVRLEVEAALARSIPVIPVLVQGAAMPKATELPASLEALARRQAAVLDHAEFHDDAERLCDRLAPVLGPGDSTHSWLRRWWPAAALAAALGLGLAGYLGSRTDGRTAASPDAASAEARADALVVEAAAERRRNQFVDALATLARARELVPDSAAVRGAQEGIAMEWIRNVRVESGSGSFGDAIGPALAVVDASLASATGTHRADLLAHSGWASFLLWRDGDRRLDPAETYREALSLDPENPYANAMLAHWILFRTDDVPAAVKLFDAAARTGRDVGAVRSLQWAAYGNSSAPEAAAERVRLADAMRRAGQELSPEQAQALWGPYYFATTREKERQALLGALPPDDHIATLDWAFEEYAANDESRRLTIRYYVALLHARAGRAEQAVSEMRALNSELAQSPGSLRQAVQKALDEL